jgi:ABC-type lipoprotein release transport system permease subunit
MRLYLRLAWRNIWRHRSRTLIVVGAIGFTLSLLMFYDGLIAGFEDAIYGNAIKVLGGNIQIHAVGYQEKEGQNPLIPLPDDAAAVKAALSQPQVVAASRRINTSGLATSPKGAFAVGISGIEPEKELPVNLIAQNVKQGRYLTADDQDSILIGKGLADAMDVKVGDRFSLAGRAPHQQIRSRTMTVVGIYDVGMADIERRTVYLSLAEAQDLYGLNGQSTEVVVALKQIGQEPTVIKAIQPSLPGYEMASWQTSYPELQSAIETKGAAMNIFGIIIMIVVGIGIFNLLLMAIYERTREIGLLAALGLKPGQISAMFLLEGTMLGLVGIAVGVGLGLLLNFTMSKVGMDFGQFTSMSTYTALISGKVYTTLGLEKIVSHVLVILVIVILASFYPAYEAAHQEPAKSLHYV